MVRCWFQRFRSGAILEDKEARYRPSEVYEHQLKAVIENDQLKTTRDDPRTQRSPFNNRPSLGYDCKCEKALQAVTQELSETQKNRRYETCPALLLRKKNERFLGRIVTCATKSESFTTKAYVLHPVQSLDMDSSKALLEAENAPDEDYGDCVVVL